MPLLTRKTKPGNAPVQRRSLPRPPIEASVDRRSFLKAGGIEVVAMASADIITAAEVGAMTPEAVVALAVSHDHPDAQAVLVPDTAMRTLGEINAVEAALGKPVLTANQVTVWEGLRMTGQQRLVRSLGALFRLPARSR